MKSKRATDNSLFNNKKGLKENEAKVKFMNFKNQDVLFFNSLPHFDCDSPRNIKKDGFDSIDSCPTKRLNFFNCVKDSFNQCKNFNSYLFKNK